MKYKQKAYSREKRKEQIIAQFRIWLSKDDDEPKTMTRIARALDMTPSQHVTDMLLELVEEGKLTFQLREKSGRWTARGFLLADTNPLSRSNLKRKIVVNHNGKVAGQLELWL